jgi:predicted Zn-dependent protease
MYLLRLLSLLSVILLVSACAGSAYKLPVVNADEITQAQNEIDSDSRKIKTYERSDAHYEKRVKKIAQRLKKNAQPLCDHAEYPSCYFEVKYDSDNTVNAYAHEDYKITIFKGLLKFLKNDEEMAAVIAHEMGHHLAHHNKETEQNAMTGALLAGTLMAVLTASANANNPYYNSYQQQQDQQAIENVMMAGAQIGALSYSKEQEREADLLAVYLLEAANYDLEKARNLTYVFSQIEGDDVEGKAALLSTHPEPVERYVSWAKAIDEVKANDLKLPYKNAPVKH